MPKNYSSRTIRAAQGLWSRKTSTRPRSLYAIRREIPVRKGKRKALIVTCPTTTNTELWLYYPQGEHIPAFAESSKKLIPGFGSYSGAVGSMSVSKENPESWIINQIRGHYKIEKNGPVTSRLASDYAGWQIRLLEELFDSRFGDRVSISYIDPAMETNLPYDRKTAVPVFVKVAESRGFRVRWLGSHLIAEKE